MQVAENTMNEAEIKGMLEDAKAAAEMARAQLVDLVARVAQMEDEGGGPAADGEMWSLQPHLGQSGGGGTLDGFWIVNREGDGTFILMEAVMANYNSDVHDDWSLEFPVSSLALNVGGWSASNQTERYVGDPQSMLRIPVIRTSGGEPRRVSMGGELQEVILCVDGKPKVNLI